MPGFAVDFDGLNVPVLDVCGFRKPPILYLLNGQSLSGVVSGDAKNIGMMGLPIKNINRIEVALSPGSSR